MTLNPDKVRNISFIGWRQSRGDRKCLHCKRLIRKGEMYFRWDTLAWCTKDCAQAMASANAKRAGIKT